MNLEAALETANASMTDLVARLGAEERTDVTHLPAGALAWAIARALEADPQAQMVVATASLDEAYRHEANLRFLLGGANDDVMVFPGSDTSPLLDVVPDRRAEMHRMAVLGRLASGAHWRVLVVPAPALLRRLPPVSYVEASVHEVSRGELLDREHLVERLQRFGYLRVPLVEDRGTFSVRGAIVDVYPPGTEPPHRIELDDDRISRIRQFDPDTQKTGEEAESVRLGAAREVPDDPEAIDRAKQLVRELCDDMNMPTLRAREISAELDRGSGALISNALLPGYYTALDTLLDYVPDTAQLVWVDPLAIASAVGTELRNAEHEHDARADRPTFPLERYFQDQTALVEQIEARSSLLAHGLAVHGEAAEDEGALLSWSTAPGESLLRLDADDQAMLVGDLRAHRGSGERGLQPLVDRVASWVEQGIRVVLVGRTQHQADRLVDLLRGYSVAAGVLEDMQIGELRDGFVLYGDAIAYVTEEEIFGTRVRQRRTKRATRRQQQRFLEDLRELAVGDYVVHADHGVGRYLGLQHKALSVTALDRL
ncbi:MAG: CarD family transcriptional regulator, partial [Myxococcota bacterium]